MNQDLRIAESKADRVFPATLSKEVDGQNDVAVLLTGGIDRPYTFGLAMELVSKGVRLEIIGSDSLDFPEFHVTPGLSFLNLQGDQRPDVNFVLKVTRLLLYYTKLIRYAARSKDRIFHILWNNKFEFFDRTVLTSYYKVLGKKIILTVHNVNARRRDSNDSFLNRLTLRVQYQLADHIFVHTEAARSELINSFGIRPARVSVIPFGINNSLLATDVSAAEAKKRLGIETHKKVILFFGRITPYKGLELLAEAFEQIATSFEDYHLIVAGRPENDSQKYWNEIELKLSARHLQGKVLLKPEHIPDDDTELYFKAADVLVLPYRQIYQSGVLFLAYSFGLPVLGADVEELKAEIIEGSTGFTFKAGDSTDLVKVIKRYFASDLFLNLNLHRNRVRDDAAKRHSWSLVGVNTLNVYSRWLSIGLRSARCQAHEPSYPERPANGR